MVFQPASNVGTMIGTGSGTHEKKGDDSAVDVIKTHNHDVLCGRGGQSNNHPGNEWFRRLVRSNRVLYKSCPKHTKLLVAKAIVQAVQQQVPPGRFIKLKEIQGGEKNSVWVPITYTQAVNKTSQALREKENRESSRSKKKPQQEPDISKTAHKGSMRNKVRTNTEIKNTNSREKIEQLKQPEIPPRVGQKRKIMDSIGKPSWWRMKSSSNDMNGVDNNTSNSHSLSASTEALDTTVTDGRDMNLNNTDNNKRMKVSNRAGNNLEISHMGRGEVKQAQQNSSSSPTQKIGDMSPFPMETTLEPRQSTLFRLLNNTGFFGRGNSVAPAPAPVGAGGFDVDASAGRSQHQNANVSQDNSHSAQWSQAQKMASDIVSNLQYQQYQRPSIPPFSSGYEMGRMSVQQLRSQQIKEHQRVLTSGSKNRTKPGTNIAGASIMENLPTSGLMVPNGRHYTDGDNGGTPPPLKGLKTQMSDWLNSFFPSAKDDELTNSSRHTDTNVLNPSSPDDIDNDTAAIPPPPGGGAGLGRSVSSAIFGLVESPSLLLSTLKSGVSSLFGDFSQATGDLNPSQIRRFPSTFQHQQMRQHQQQQPQQSILQQQFKGNLSAGGGMMGNHPVLGERATGGGSLLEDFEETPMEMELRNAKPEELSRGSLYR